MRYLCGVLLMAALALATGGCGKEEAEYYGTVSVTGSGAAYGEADVASIVFGVDIIEEDPGVAVDRAAELMDRAFAAALEQGVAEEDMKTTSYSLWAEEQYDYATYVYSGDVNYHVTHYAQVEVRDLERVGEVLSELVNSGSNTIQSVSFRVEDSRSLVEDARSSAMENARTKAEQLAAELGMEVGEATYVSEYMDYYYPMSGAADFTTVSRGETAPSISAGAQSVSLSVQVTFELKQPPGSL
ncbi:MAG: hypothetical protein AVO35_11330 [Candidatus Aegiribacteria sp. MLS_C]|nr:MAG: hypothetical protein AVO35_11330 [Candidatus Aegiribacteria sp. MLS_C]